MFFWKDRLTARRKALLYMHPEIKSPPVALYDRKTKQVPKKGVEGRRREPRRSFFSSVVIKKALAHASDTPSLRAPPSNRNPDPDHNGGWLRRCIGIG